MLRGTRGVHGYSTGTTQAVLDYAPPGARLIFSCGWRISLGGQDVYSLKLKNLVKVYGPLARLARFADLDDQVEAARRIFASETRWTVVRGSDLEEGESQGLPVWSRHVGDPILESKGVLSVTITGPDLATADAYATTALAMGTRAARWTTTLVGYEAMTILADKRVLLTKGFPAGG